LPAKSQKSVTLPIELYEHLMKEYQQRRVKLFADEGISSFTGFVVWMLRIGVKEWDRAKKVS